MANYYVATPANGGSNAKTGLIGQPWATVEYACNNAVTVGDIINIGAGSFTLGDYTMVSVGVSLVGTGSTTILTSTTASGGLYLYSDPVVGGNQTISYISFNGSNISTQAIDIRKRHNVSVHHCTFTDYKSGVKFYGTGTSVLAPTIFCTGNTFHDNVMNNCSIYSGGGSGALYIGSQDGFLCYNNDIEQTQRSDGSNGYLIKMGDSWGWNKGLKIYDNILTKNKQGAIVKWDFALELGNVVGCEIYNNTILGCIDVGTPLSRYLIFNAVYRDDYEYDMWCHDNIMGQTSLSVAGAYSSQAFDFENNCRNILVERNIINNVKYPFHFFAASGDTISNNTFQKNILTNIGTDAGGGSAFLWGNDGLCTIDNINVYNNTIVAVSGASAGADGIALPGIGAATDINIVNNIIVGFYRNSIRAILFQSGATIDRLNIMNNDMYANGGSNIPDYSELTPTNLVYSGYIYTNPLFISTTNFSLQSSSPARNAGIDVGLPYLENKPDIGAIEYGTYFVETYENGGRDTNDGSWGSPWLTLAYACSQVTTSGKTIHIGAGTFVETSVCSLAVGVNIIGEGDTTNIVCNYNSGSSSSGLIQLHSTIQKTNGNQSISYVKIDGNDIGLAGITISRRSNIKIHHCTFVNFLSYAAYFRGVVPAYPGFDGAYVVPTLFETGNEIYNCTVTDCSSRDYGGGSIGFSNQDGLLIHDNICHNTGRPDNQNGNIVSAWWGFFKGVKIYNNKFYKPLIETTGWNFTGEVGMSYGGNEIYNNEFYNGTCLDIAAIENVKGTYDYSWWIHDNLFQMDSRISSVNDYHGTYAIAFEGTNEGAIVNNNHVVNYPYGMSAQAAQTPRYINNMRFHNNVFENMGHSNNNGGYIFLLGCLATGNTVENIYYDNNTMVGSSAALYFRNVDILRNVYFRNNIVKDVVQYGWVYIRDNTGTLQDVYLLNNDTYNNVGSNSIYYQSGASVITNLVQTGGITTDPLFVSSTDFGLQATSPAINTGIDVGLPYNGTAPDMGAFEYGIYFDSINGNDSGYGTTTNPYKSISKLNTLLGTAATGTTFYLKRGCEWYGTITPTKSGVYNGMMTIDAYGSGNDPIITGFVAVTGWTNLGSNIWESTSAVSTLSKCNMVAINGVNTPMGRYPNTGYLNIDSVSGQVSITNNTLINTPNYTGGELVVRDAAWALDRTTITNHTNGTLTYSPTITYTPQINFGFFIQNHINTLTSQNAWYYNSSTKKIRIYSTSQPVDVKVATIETLCVLDVNYIQINNISFLGANSYGIYNNSNFQNNNTIQNCVLSFIGIDAISTNSKYSTITDCTISDCNNRGIKLTDDSTNTVISYNIITNIGILNGMGQNSTYTRTGIICNASNSIVEYNNLYNIGYIGISFDGNNTIVRNNVIDTFCFVLDDGGGIYTYKNPSNPAYTNRKVQNNIVVNGIGAESGRTGGPNTQGIYMDDATQYVEISGNTISNCSYVGIYIHNANDINIHNNTVHDCQQQLSLNKDSISSNLIRNISINNNILVAKENYQLIFEHRSNINDILLFGTYDNNCYTRPILESNSISANPGGVWTTYNLTSWKSYSGQDLNSTKSPTTISYTNQLRFEYNSGLTNLIVPLDGIYMKVDGTVVDSITLLPYTSEVLIETGIYFDSINGNDAGSGTTASPYKSISKLNTLLGTVATGTTFYLKRGCEWYGTITPTKSGIYGGTINIDAYGEGEDPIITGFVSVTGWTNLGGNIWESSTAVTSLSTLNIVTINGVNTPMGRLPNTGYYYFQSHTGSTSISSSNLTGATNWTGAELAFNCNDWTTKRCPITSQSGNKLTFTNPESFTIIEDNLKFIIQNDIRTLDTQNEWYFNPTTKKISIYSIVPPVNVEVATVDNLVSVTSKNYITFNNISFKGANSNAFSLGAVNYFTIQNCNTDFVGHSAIYGSYAGNSTNLTVSNCNINHSNNGGIGLSYMFNNANIQSNTVNNSGMIYGATAILTSGTNGAGIGVGISVLSQSGGTTIQYNNVENSGYHGINFYGSNTMVKNNYVNKYCQNTYDGAGIYTWNGTNTTCTGTKVFNNVVINTPSTAVYNPNNYQMNAGIYLDSQSNGIEIYNNTVSVPDDYGLFVNGGHDMNLHNNISFNCNSSVRVNSTTVTNIIITDNTFVAKSASQLIYLLSTIVSGIISNNNYLARPINDTTTISSDTLRTLAQWQSYSGQDLNSHKSPIPITYTDQLRFEYNSGNTDRTVLLDGVYMKFDGTIVSGSTLLDPYSSIVLLETGIYFDNISGSDSGSGTTTSPYKTITKLNTLLGTVNTGTTFYLKRGSEWTGSTITPTKSGTSLNPISIDAYGEGEKPIVSGFQTVTGWVQSGTTGIWYKSGIVCQVRPEVVTIDDVQYGMGRWPDLGTNYYTNGVTGNTSMSGTQLNSSVINWTGAELILKTSDYTQDRCTITSHSNSKLTYTNNGSGLSPFVGTYYFIQNDIRTLTNYGEWVYSGTTLYMYFGSVVPTTKTVKISILDKAFYTNYINYFNIKNIEFQGGNRILTTDNSNYFIISGCTTKYAGQNGIDLAGNFNTISNCEVNDVNKAGISITGTFNVVNNNIINNCGLIEGSYALAQYQNGILNSGTDNTYQYNYINNIAYNGIRIASGSRCLVKNNFINNFCLTANDGGGIYTAGGVTTDKIFEGNIITNGIGKSPILGGTLMVEGIYIDEIGDADVLIKNNTVAYCAYSGIKLHNVTNVQISGNTSYGNHTAIRLQESNASYPVSGISITYNTFIASSTGKTSLTLNKAGYTDFGTSNYNYFARPIDDDDCIYTSDPTYGGVYRTLSSWQTYSGEDANSKKSPKTITYNDQLRLEYNTGLTNTFISLNGTYKRMNGDIVTGITLAPFTSEVLIETGIYFDSINGNDNWSGTTTYPYKSITKLNSLLSTTQTGTTFYLKRGSEWTGSTITPTKSGTSLNPISIDAYGEGEKPIVSGFQTITGWIQSGVTNIWYKVLPTISDITMLTIDNVQQPMGRYPNTGWLYSDQVTGTTKIYDASLPTTPNWTGAEAIICKNNWDIGRNLISNHTSQTLTINGNTQPLIVGWGYYIQNHISTLDTLGDWYFNSGTSTLYMYFGVNPASKIVKATIKEYVVSFNQNVNYINFNNISLKGANKYGIYLNHNDNIIIDNCDVSYCGQVGINLYVSDYTQILNTLVDTCNDIGIITASYSDNTIIRGCTVKNIETIFGQGISTFLSGKGIYATQGNNLLIEQNRLDNISYIGIDFSCSIDFTIKNAIIRKNYLTNTMMTKQDGGAIYGYQQNTGTTTICTVEDNIIIGTGYLTPGKPVGYEIGGRQGIYIDQGNLQPIHINRNSISECNGHGIFVHSSKFVNITNNNVYSCEQQLFFQESPASGGPDFLTITNLIVTGNTFVAKESTELTIWARLEPGSVFTQLGTLNNNYYARPISDVTTIKAMVSVWDSTPISLSAWKTLTNQDINSNQSPTSIPSTDKLRFEYNTGSTTKTIFLEGSYIKINGEVIGNDYIDILPYSSITLIESGIYFDSINGNDSGSGTTTSPYKSITKLNSVLSTVATGTTIYLKRGSEWYGTITPTKSGVYGGTITIDAYGEGENPIITGFATVTGWTYLGSNIWESSSAISTLSTCNMVTIGDVNTPKGRLPNTGYYYYQSHSGTTQITSNNLTGATNWTGAELAFCNTTYTIARVPITNQVGSTLTFTPDSVNNYIQMDNQRFIIQNDIRTLDTQNEWYFNPSTKKISVYSVGQPVNVKVTAIDYLVNQTSKSYITFKNIDFIGSNSATFYLSVANYLTIQNCKMTYAGNWAVYGIYAHYSDYFTIENCTIDQSNGGAIGVTSDFRNAIVRSNTITNTGMIFGAFEHPISTGNAAGIYAGISAQGEGTLIENNSIENTGYVGIRFKGNNSIVSKNFIDNAMSMLHDGGAIYTWNGNGVISSNMQVINNIILNSPEDCGLYLDDKTNHVTVTGNSVSNCEYGIYLNNAYDNIITNNTIYNNSGSALLLSNSQWAGQLLTGNMIHYNKFVAKESTHPLMFCDYIEKILPGMNNNNNYYCRPINDTTIITAYQRTPTFLASYYTLSQWKTYSNQDSNSQKSPVTITYTDQLRYEYNSGATDRIVSLDGVYTKIDGTIVSGSIILSPYSSEILIETGIYFDSINGNDSGSGTTTSPYKSISKLNTVLSTVATGTTIYLKRGSEWYGTITPTKSGAYNGTINIDAYGEEGENPIITGFQTLTGWTQSGSTNIWYTTLSTSRLNVVTVNNTVKPMGRYPNTGWLSYESHNGTTSITDTSLTNTPNWTGGEVVIRKTRWVIDRHTITNHTNSTLTYSTLSDYGNNTRAGIDKNGYFIQGHIGTLDTLGDWYFNSGTSRLYMYFTTNPSNYVVKASDVDRNVYVNGRSHINFNNINFKGANLQGTSVLSSNYIKFTNCNFYSQGGTSIYGSNSNYITISGGTVTDSLNNGIWYEVNTNNCIIDNVSVNNSGMIAGSTMSGDGVGQGIFITGNNNTIKNSSVKYSGYNAINFFGNDILIENNYINNFCSVKDDGGGIYTYTGGNGTATNRIVRKNIILNGIGAYAGAEGDVNYTWGWATGIYLDDNSENVSLSGNTISSCDNAGVFVHMSKNCQLLYNTIYDCRFLVMYEHYNVGEIVNIIQSGNTLVSKTASQDVIYYHPYVNETPTVIGTMNYNYYARPISDNAPLHINMEGFGGSSYKTLAQWQSLYSQDLNSNKSPISITYTNQLRIEYNSGVTDLTIPLNARYIKIDGTIANDSITLLPFTSEILIETGIYFDNVLGSDSGSGTTASPYKTITKLNTLLSTAATGATFYLKRGSEWTGTTITSTRNGIFGAPITISAYGEGENPIVSGFKTITNWTQSGSTNIWYTTISSESQTNMVTIDDVSYGMGRYPSLGTYLTYESATGLTTIRDNQLTNTPNWTGADAVITRNGWLIDRCVITNHTNSTITATATVGSFPYVAPNNYFIQNDIRCVTDFGEWYHNTGTSTFYMHFGGVNPNTKTVKVATLNNTIYVYGDYTVIDNIIFTGSIKENIKTSTSNYSIIQNCNVLFSGTDAINMSGSNDIIRNNVINDCHKVAIYCAAANGVDGNYTINDNIITNTGMIEGMGNLPYLYNAAIFIYNDLFSINRNSIINCGYDGINLSQTVQTGNITNNYFYNTCVLRQDQGSIYTTSTKTNLLIDGNIILNSVSQGIYLDQDSENVTVSNNTIANGVGGDGIKIHMAHGNTIINNTCYNNYWGIGLENWENLDRLHDNTITGNISVAKEADQEALSYIQRYTNYTNDFVSSFYDNNYYARPIDDNLTIYTNLAVGTTYRTLAQWKTFTGQDINSQKSPIPITYKDQLRFEYNSGSTSKIVSLDGVYKDITNTTYSNSLTLEPYRSIVLIETGIYFDSINGNDAGSGTTASPYKSISKLNTLLGTVATGTTIYLKRGSEWYGTITPTKSGVYGGTITIDAYGEGPNPIITGFATVTGWTYLGSNIWESSSAISTLSTCNMVTIGDVNTPKGRLPNTGYYYYQSHSGTTQITSNNLTGTPNWTGAELAFCNTTYTIARVPITNQVGGTLTFTPDSVNNYIQMDNQRFIIQNDIRTLDTQNEWYFNPSTKKISVYSVGQPINVKVSTVDYLVNQTSKSYITFKNINFIGSNSATFYLSVANYSTIQNCNMSFAGNWAVYGIYAHYSDYFTIENCTIDQSNGGAIGVTSDFRNAIVRSNTITNTGMIFGAFEYPISTGNAAGIYAGISAQGEGTLIENNSIENTGYVGIRFKGNNSIVSKNFIDNAMSMLHDGGAIYTWNGNGVISSNMQVINNIILNSPEDCGLYLDDKTNHVTVTGNSVSNCEYGIYLNNAYDNIITNNTVYNNSGSDLLLSNGQWAEQILTGNIIHYNKFVAKESTHPLMFCDYIEKMLPGMNNNNNYYCRPINDTTIITAYQRTPTFLASYYTLATWQTYSGQDANSKKSPIPITYTNQLRFEYNSGLTDKVVSLNASYMKVDGTVVDSITLSPFTSEVLIETGIYFDSINGSDSGSGTTASPYKSISKLNSLLGTVNTGTTFYLKRGSEWTGSTITTGKSGTAIGRITIDAYGEGEKPIISGFRTITNWTQSGTTGIWYKSLSPQSSVNLVTVDGANTAMGRYPTTGWLTYEAFTGNTVISDTSLSSTPNWTGAELVMRVIKWELPRCLITNHTGTRITYTPRTTLWSPTAGYGYFIQNDIKTLDTFGEWYFNSGTSTFYMYFGLDLPTNHEVKVAVTDNLIYTNNKNYITIQNLKFTGANKYGVQNLNTYSNNINNCTFDLIGINAIYNDNTLSYYGELTVSGNTITNCNDQAIDLSSRDGRWLIKNNYINNIGIIPGAGTGNDKTGNGISMAGPDGIIEYNTIDNVGHSGIAILTATGMTVRNNYITNFGMTRYDAGGIYSWNGSISTTRPRYIYNNIILNSNQLSSGIAGDTSLSLFGIYLDEYSNDTIVSGNTTAFCNTNGIHVSDCGFVTIKNNTSFDNKGSQLSLRHTQTDIDGIGHNMINMNITNNKLISKLNTQYTFRYREDLNGFTSFGTSDYNYFARPIDDNLTIETVVLYTSTFRTLSGWQTLSGKDLNSHKSPVNITYSNQIYFDYNTGSTNKYVNTLSSGFKDLNGNVVTEYTLAPFESVILLETGIYFDNILGSDSGSGTTTSPYKTMTKLNSVASTMNTGTTLYLKRGSEWSGSTITPTKSGTALNPMAIDAYGTGDKPKITGFQTISGWIQSGVTNIWYKTISPQSTPNMVTIDGVNTPKGRFPKSYQSNGGYLTFEGYTGNTAIYDSYLTGTPNWTGSEIIIRVNTWSLGNGKVTSQNGGILNYTGISQTPTKVGLGYFFQNDLKCLTEFGDWCYVSGNSTFYMHFGTENPTNHTVKVSVIDELLYSNYRTYLSLQGRYYTFNNLSFEGAIKYGIHINAGTGITISNCDFNLIGLTAIIDYGTTYSLLITNNNINNCNDQGMTIIANYPVISYNTVTNIGLLPGMGLEGGGYSGIELYDSNLSGATIEYNTITNVGDNGIQLRGSFNLVKNNFISYFGMTVDDCGGLYYSGENSKGDKIIGNIILYGMGNRYGLNPSGTTNGTASEGIYLDSITDNKEIYGNTVAHCGAGGIRTHDSYDIMITGNTLFNNRFNFYIVKGINNTSYSRNITINNNISVSTTQTTWTQYPYKILTYVNENPLLFGTSNFNYLMKPITNDVNIVDVEVNAVSHNYYNLSTWQAYSNNDLNSHKSPTTISYNNQSRLEYNTGLTNLTIPLEGVYMKVDGTIVRDSITLLPYSSVVLLETGTYFDNILGSDSGSGTTISPFKTITKLNTVLSTINTGSTAYLKRGSEWVGSTITPTKSGVSGRTITIDAYGTDTNKPVISGFVTVTGWTNLGSNIWESSLAVSTLSTCIMVVINGVNTPMGRIPNTGYYTILGHTGNTMISSNDLTGTPNWTGAEVVIKKRNWILQRSNIIGQTGKTISYVDQEAGGFSPYDGYGFFIQNDVRTLDTQNDWYFNPTTKKIRIYSITIPTDVKVASLGTLFNSNYKNYITINNLTFEGANSSCVTIFGSTGITISNCDIMYGGLDGINSSWSYYSDIQNNTIKQCNDTGILISNHTDYDIIKHNIIDYTSMIPGISRGNAPGAIYCGSPNVLIQYNNINHSGYNGILTTGNYAQIRNNFIDNSLLNRNDGGGIYPGGDNVTTIVDGNIVLNTVGDLTGSAAGSELIAMGIYLDLNTTNTTVSNNTCAYNGEGGISLGQGNVGNVITGNLLYGNAYAQIMMSDWTGSQTLYNTVMNNNMFIAKESTEYAAEFRSAINNIPMFFSAADNNYYARPIDDNKTIRAGQPDQYTGTLQYKTLSEWQIFSGKDVNSHKSPMSVPATSKLRFEYNSGLTNMTINLGGNYMKMDGTVINSIILAPYTSVVLMSIDSVIRSYLIMDLSGKLVFNNLNRILFA